VKGIFALAALAAAVLWLSMPSGSGAVSGIDASDLRYSVQSQGETWGQPHEFDLCVSVGTGLLCKKIIRQNMPPQAYRLLECEAEGENCTVLKTFDGEESCHLLIKHGGRDAATEDCVWGTGHIYTLIALVGIVGDVDLAYTHEPQEWYLGTKDGIPQFGPVGGDQTLVIIDEDCRETVKAWPEGGKIGPAPECRARTYRYEQDTGTTPVE